MKIFWGTEGNRREKRGKTQSEFRITSKIKIKKCCVDSVADQAEEVVGGSDGDGGGFGWAVGGEGMVGVGPGVGVCGVWVLL